MSSKAKPDWAGADPLSKVVNVLINTPPLYAVMKQQARRTIIKTAERNGISWRKNYRDLENSAAQSLLAQVTNPDVTYPDYYQVPFHAYDRGNLCWQAAFEAESATQAMGLRVWKQETLTWQEAQARLRGGFHDVLADYLPAKVNDVLDVGCSVGISTRTLYNYLKQRQGDAPRVVGLDLSPYMLAVAKVLDEEGAIARWVHGQAEATGFADNSFDLVTLQFLLHELPQEATRQIFREIRRILRPGGIVAIVDNNPASPVIQNLPPALFVLMKSTEPWSDEYYTFDVSLELQAAGLDYRTTFASDPRHRTVIAFKPS